MDTSEESVDFGLFVVIFFGDGDGAAGGDEAVGNDGEVISGDFVSLLFISAQIASILDFLLDASSLLLLLLASFSLFLVAFF